MGHCILANCQRFVKSCISTTNRQYSSVNSNGGKQNIRIYEVRKKCSRGDKTHTETHRWMKRKFVACWKNTMHVLAMLHRCTSPLYWLTANLLIIFFSYRVKSHSFFFSLDVCPIWFLYYKLLRNNFIATGFATLEEEIEGVGRRDV